MDLLESALAQGAGLSAAAGLLARLRPMHRAGAAKAAAGDQKLTALLARGAGAAELLARLERLAGAKACLACGTCCVTSSPTLYQEGLALVHSGAIPLKNLFTLRAGERAFSARLGKSAPLEAELIKLAEASGGGCVYLQDCLCSAYESRPLQCRTLKCWEDSHAGKLTGLARPGRGISWPEMKPPWPWPRNTITGFRPRNWTGPSALPPGAKPGRRSRHWLSWKPTTACAPGPKPATGLTRLILPLSGADPRLIS